MRPLDLCNFVEYYCKLTNKIMSHHAPIAIRKLHQLVILNYLRPYCAGGFFIRTEVTSSNAIEQNRTEGFIVLNEEEYMCMIYRKRSHSQRLQGDLLYNVELRMIVMYIAGRQSYSKMQLKQIK